MRPLTYAGATLWSLAILSAVSCVGSSTTVTVTHPTAPSEMENDTPMKRPFMFKEAKLPRGFPPPGPVGQIIVKDYPAYRLARVRSGKEGVSGGPNAMFNPLFNHIKRNDIPMTAPVEISYPNRPHVADEKDRAHAESMAFLYGDPAWGKLGADDADHRVVVEDVPAMKVVSIGVRGSYTDAHFSRALSRLIEWIQARSNEFQVVGPPRYLGYNSPFVLGFLRYGEVQLPIEKVKAVSSPPLPP